MNCEESDQAQVISISGLTIQKLTDCFNVLPRSTKVDCVNIHVGINDCKGGSVVPKHLWKTLIHKTKQTFPNADIHLSSILPFNGKNKHVANCIDTTNDVMYHVCWETYTGFIDHDESFYTRDWSIKNMWYRDAIHPNKRGTSELARTMKRSIHHTRRQSQQRHSPKKYIHDTSSKDRSTASKFTNNPSSGMINNSSKNCTANYTNRGVDSATHHKHDTYHEHDQDHRDKPPHDSYSDAVRYGRGSSGSYQNQRPNVPSCSLTRQQNNYTQNTQDSSRTRSTAHVNTPSDQQAAVSLAHNMYLSMVGQMLELSKLLHTS